MNLSAIKTLTGAGKYCTVLNTPDGRQWITEGHAAWLVEDVKIESAATMASLFNLSEKQRDKARIDIKDTTSPIYCKEDAIGEETLEELGMIWLGGVPYIGLMSSRGAIWIQAELLKPVREDYRQYYVRWHDGDTPTVAVYDDLMTCKAIVLPLTNGGGEMLRQKAAEMCAPIAEWTVDRGDIKEA